MAKILVVFNTCGDYYEKLFKTPSNFIGEENLEMLRKEVSEEVGVFPELVSVVSVNRIA